RLCRRLGVGAQGHAFLAARAKDLDDHHVSFQMNQCVMALKVMPMVRMPTVTTAMKVASSGSLITRLIMINEGSDSAVTAIMKANTVPRPTPLPARASAIGRVPNISAYIGMPTTTAT